MINFQSDSEKNKRKERTVELTFEEYADLVKKADRFELLRDAANVNGTLSDLEKTFFGLL